MSFKIRTTGQVVEQQTVLQVVKNPSWMAPYVACMIVATGMLAHFGIILFRFYLRRAEEARITESAGGLQHAGNGRPDQSQTTLRSRRQWLGPHSPNGSPLSSR